jgi:hypothetical protein
MPDRVHAHLIATPHPGGRGWTFEVTDPRTGRRHVVGSWHALRRLLTSLAPPPGLR